MPITRIFWGPIDGPRTSNQDIHVLRGNSTRDLTLNDLFFTPAGGGNPISAHDYLTANSDVQLIFQPLFSGNQAGNVFSGLQIEVDTRTGQASPGLQAGKNNFIMEVTATNPADHSTTDTETIRVHIHLSVKAFALTPATLTVRPAASARTTPETTHYRFTVRAKFDDDTMGDLTEHHGVTWSSNPPGHVNPDTGELIVVSGDVAGNTVTITGTLPAEFGGGSQTATMQIGQAWRDDPDMPLAPIVVGGGWPGTTLPDKAPNILFISDGYIDVDEPAFMRTVTTMVHHLKTDRLLRPYDLLCTSMNFWHAFVPARARGISFRCEVYEWDGSGYGWPVPPPEPPPKDGDWKAVHLIYAVGLPVPEDADKTESELRQDWDFQVGGLPRVPDGGIERWAGDELPDDRISDRVIRQWRHIASRAFIEELDNFPGMAFGAPPAANTKSGTPSLDLHPFRCRRDGLDSFLAALRSVFGVEFGPGANIGALWARPPDRQNDTEYELKDVIGVADKPGMKFVCTTAGMSDLSQPADYADAKVGDVVADGSATFQAADAVFDNARFAIVLSSFPGGRAANYGRYIATCTSAETDEIPLAPPAGIIGFALNFTAVPADAVLDASRTTAHELGHSFELGDEYVEGDVEHERTYPNGQDTLFGYVNLQTEEDTKVDGEIDGDQIRWNWPRVRKAAVVREVVGEDSITEVADGAFRIAVVPGHATQFRKDEMVRLRLRFPGLPLSKAINVNVSDALQIAVTPFASASDEYLVVKAAPGVTITLDDLKTYKPGSILFAPVPAPSPVRHDEHDYAEMVAANVSFLITDQHRPLYRQPSGAGENRDQQPDLDGLWPPLPGQPFCFKDKPRIVGLYEGGAQYARGIFHPTGKCIMCNHYPESAEFCAVCRYIMVDLVDPFRHFEIDRDYDDIYPLK